MHTLNLNVFVDNQLVLELSNHRLLSIKSRTTNRGLSLHGSGGLVALLNEAEIPIGTIRNLD